MSRFNFENHRRGFITIEIQTMKPERFINLLWKSNVVLKNIRRKNINTISFDVNLKYYDTISNIAKELQVKFKIINRKGISFFIIKNRRRKAFVGGVVIFGAIMYYLSTFIWNIDITTESNVTPFEIRDQLKVLGIGPGTNKRKIDVYDIEEKLIKNNSDIMWVRTRVEGVKLTVNIAERQEPPSFIRNDAPCNVVASKDGEIIRLFSSAGTAAVKSGDIVKKGDVLIKGEQGKEGGTYPVHAQGEVIAKTFYEEKAEVSTKNIERVRTGKKEKSIYIEIMGKKLYIKKAKNKFEKYDKMFVDKPFIKQEVYCEIEEKTSEIDKEELIKKIADELFSNIIVKLDKSVKIVDKIVNDNKKGDKYEIRVVLVVEENIGVTEIIQTQPDLEENPT